MPRHQSCEEIAKNLLKAEKRFWKHLKRLDENEDPAAKLRDLTKEYRKIMRLKEKLDRLIEIQEAFANTMHNAYEEGGESMYD